MIHEKLDIFGATCNLPTYCGQTISKKKISTSFLSDYYLCQRFNEHVNFAISELVYNIEGRAFFPTPRFEEYPTTIQKKITYSTVNDKVVVRPPIAYNYKSELDFKDICTDGVPGMRAGDSYSYSRFPDSYYIYDVYDAPFDMAHVLKEMPFAIAPVYNRSDMYYIPCREGNAHVKVNLSESTGAIASYDHKAIPLKCEAGWCYASSDRFHIKWRFGEVLHVYVNEGDMYIRPASFNRNFSIGRGHLMIGMEKPFDLLNPYLLCGLYPAEPLPKSTKAIDLNYTHYIKDFKIMVRERSFQCNTPIHLFTDVAGALSAYQHLASFVQTVLLQLISLFVDLFFNTFTGIEEFVIELISIVIKIVRLTLTAFSQMLIRTKLLFPAMVVALSYYLLYIIYRDNWMVVPIITAIVSWAVFCHV